MQFQKFKKSPIFRLDTWPLPLLFSFFFSFSFSFLLLLSLLLHVPSLLPPSFSALTGSTNCEHHLTKCAGQSSSKGAEMAGHSSTVAGFRRWTRGGGAQRRRDFTAAKLGTKMLNTLPPLRWYPPFPTKVSRSLVRILILSELCKQIQTKRSLILR